MDNLDRRSLLGAAGLVGVAALASAAKAGGGPLNPPAGAVAPTGRTTDEIYNKIPAGGAGDGRIALAGGAGPITINNPGSYILTGGVSGSGGNGINIAADHVTLDLNGHAVGSGFNTGTGVQIGGGLKGITLRNGLISGFSQGVVVLGAATNIILEDLFVKEAKTVGMSVVLNTSRAVVIRRCTVTDTGATTVGSDISLGIAGIACSAIGAVIEQCAVVRMLYNGGGSPTIRGIVLGGGTQVVRDCSVTADLSTLGAPHAGMVFPGATTIYRGNTVTGFTTKYSGGTDGGGNA